MESLVPDDEKRDTALQCIQEERRQVALPFDEDTTPPPPENKQVDEVAPPPPPSPSLGQGPTPKIHNVASRPNSASAEPKQYISMHASETPNAIDHDSQRFFDPSVASSASVMSTSSSKKASTYVVSMCGPVLSNDHQSVASAVSSLKISASNQTATEQVAAEDEENVKHDIPTLTKAVQEQEKNAKVTETIAQSYTSSSVSSAKENVMPATAPSVASSYSSSLASLSSSVQIQTKRIAQLEADALRKHQEAELAATSAREALELMVKARNDRRERDLRKKKEQQQQQDARIASEKNEPENGDVKDEGKDASMLQKSDVASEEDGCNISMCSTLSSEKKDDTVKQVPTEASVQSVPASKKGTGSLSNENDNGEEESTASSKKNGATYSVASDSQYSRSATSKGSYKHRLSTNDSLASADSSRKSDHPKDIEEVASGKIFFRSGDDESGYDDDESTLDTNGDSTINDTVTSSSTYLSRHRRALDARRRERRERIKSGGRRIPRSSEDNISDDDYHPMTPKAKGRSSRWHRFHSGTTPPPLREHDDEDEEDASMDSRSSRSSRSSIAHSEASMSTASSTLGKRSKPRMRGSSSERHRHSFSDKHHHRSVSSSRNQGRGIDSSLNIRPIQSNLLLPSLMSPDPVGTRLSSEESMSTPRMPGMAAHRRGSATMAMEPPSHQHHYRSQSASPRSRIHARQPVGKSAPMKPNHLLPYSPRMGYLNPAALSREGSERRPGALADTSRRTHNSTMIGVERPADVRRETRLAEMGANTRPAPMTRRTESEPFTQHQQPLLSQHQREFHQSADATSGHYGALSPLLPGQYSSSLTSRMANLKEDPSGRRHSPQHDATLPQYKRIMAANRTHLNVNTNIGSTGPMLHAYGSSSYTPKSLHEQERFAFMSSRENQQQHNAGAASYPVTRNVDSLSLAQHQTIGERISSLANPPTQGDTIIASRQQEHADYDLSMRPRSRVTVPSMPAYNQGNAIISQEQQHYHGIGHDSLGPRSHFPGSSYRETNITAAAGAHANNGYYSNNASNNVDNYLDTLPSSTPSKVRFASGGGNLYGQDLEKQQQQQQHYAPSAIIYGSSTTNRESRNDYSSIR